MMYGIESLLNSDLATRKLYQCPNFPPCLSQFLAESCLFLRVRLGFNPRVSRMFEGWKKQRIRWASRRGPVFRMRRLRASVASGGGNASGNLVSNLSRYFIPHQTRNVP